ncbi:ABC transporter permease [Halalkalibacterium halodurans]|uniref:ABC-2 type transporter transmembrane domain-containing protein n=1 Tax=Halalkalibacterium halodurans TaxID=86665 RepID=A0A0M0KLT5_ALKHA|nr:ABC transporter permease [Halalkalibacterium halodurans]TPE66165.1 ABC transporter permease [Halalkalibacterium halodurans]
MNNFWTVVGHSYMNKVKSKVFVISTAVTLTFVLLFANVDLIINLFEAGESKEPAHVAILDETGEWYPAIAEVLDREQSAIVLTSFTESEKEGQEAVSSGQFDGMLVLREGADVPEATYYYQSVNQAVTAELQHGMQTVKEAQATADLGLSDEQLQQIYAPVSFTTEPVEEGEGAVKTEEEVAQASFLVVILLFVIYFSVIMYCSMIATEVATEKSSRVMEILISSVSPVTHMFGKIVGIALVALSQFFLIVLIGGVNALLRMSAGTGEGLGVVSDFVSLDALPVGLMMYALLFYILSYFLFATLAAMLGSIVSRIEDVNSAVGPINFLVIVAFFIAMFGMNAPESSFVTVTSFVPFFTPMIMFLRVGMLDVPLWEVALSIAFLVGTIGLFAILAARVYRGGVLLYGNSSSWKHIKTALALSKRER